METGIKVIDAMTRMPIVIKPTATVTECAKLMEKSRVGSLLIIDGKKLCGIVTEGDLIRRVLAKNISPDKTLTQEIMTRDIVSVSPSMDIYEAIVYMNNFNIRHAPVMHNGVLEGFLTLKDILKIEPELFDMIVDKFDTRKEIVQQYDDS